MNSLYDCKCSKWSIIILTLLALPYLSYGSSRSKDTFQEHYRRKQPQQQGNDLLQRNQNRITEIAGVGLIQQNRSPDGKHWINSTRINKKHKAQTLSALQNHAMNNRFERKKIVSDGSTSTAAATTTIRRETKVENASDKRRMQTSLAISTPFNGPNGNYGVMFDLSSPASGSHSVTIKSIEINANIVDPECPVKVYTKRESHQGFETSSWSWKLLVDGTTNCVGFGQRTVISNDLFQLDDTDVTLAGGETISFYVSLTTPDLRYSNGNEFGSILASDPDNKYLQLHEGTGLAEFFGVTFAPRAFNGIINFVVNENDNQPGASSTSSDVKDTGCDAVLATTYADNLGSYGNMFDIETKGNDIEIYQVDIYTDVTTPVTYELYTRVGSYIEGASMDAWTLLASGTVTGMGNNLGTPIRNFEPFTVPANSRIGFYSTLTSPDIRYVNLTQFVPDAKLGDVYFENEDLEIEVGVSIGTYPLAEAVYGPRVWSGAIHYRPDKSCPTFSPSLPVDTPSITSDTWTPTAVPTADSASGAPPDYGNCTQTSHVETTFEGGTGAFGNMFTVFSKDEPISITTLSLHTENENSEISVFVYMKLGDYHGYENDKSAWSLICDTTVVSSGTGFGTKIPEADFDPIHMVPDQQVALYVTVSSPDLRYSRTDKDTGEPVVETDYIAVTAGAGLTTHPFSKSLFEPRVFNGEVHVHHAASCYTDISTVVTYSFVVQHQPDFPEDEVLQVVPASVHTSIKMLLAYGSNSTLAPYINDHDLRLDNVTSIKSDAHLLNPDLLEGCVPDFPCFVVDVLVTVSHLNSASSGEVTKKMLQLRDEINDNLKGADFQSEIYGTQTVTSHVVITLNGEFDSTMNDDESSYFEAVTSGFYNDQFEGDESNLTVTGMTITGQEIGTRRNRRSLRQLVSRFLQREGDDYDGNGAHIDVSATVTGEYKPPPDVNFDTKVSSAISENEDDYVEDLKTGGDVQLTDDGIVRSMPFFEKVEAVDVKIENAPPTLAPTALPHDDGGVNLGLIAGVVLGGIVVCAVIIFCWQRRGLPENAGAVGVVGLDSNPLDSRRGLFFGKRSSNRDLFDDKVMDAQVMYAHASSYNDGGFDEVSQMYGQSFRHPQDDIMSYGGGQSIRHPQDEMSMYGGGQSIRYNDDDMHDDFHNHSRRGSVRSGRSEFQGSVMSGFQGSVMSGFQGSVRSGSY